MEIIKKVSIINETDLKDLPFKIIESIIKGSKGNFKFVSIKDGIELTPYLIKKNLIIALTDIFSIDVIPTKFLLEEISNGEKLDNIKIDNNLQEFFSLIEEITQKWKNIKKEMIKKGFIKILNNKNKEHKK